MNILTKLLKLANNLDAKGLYEEASTIDKILFAHEEESKSMPDIDELEEVIMKVKNLLGDESMADDPLAVKMPTGQEMMQRLRKKYPGRQPVRMPTGREMMQRMRKKKQVTK